MTENLQGHFFFKILRIFSFTFCRNFARGKKKTALKRCSTCGKDERAPGRDKKSIIDLGFCSAFCIIYQFLVNLKVGIVESIFLM